MDSFKKCTCSWYSSTGSSSSSLGPNWRRVAEKRTAIVKANFRLTTAILDMDTLPLDKAPSEAPKRLLGSWERKGRKVLFEALRDTSNKQNS